MAFVDIPGWPIPYPAYGGGSAGISFVTLTMDAAAEKVAWIIKAPRSGTLNRVGFRLSTVAQAPTNGLTVSFQNVATTGNPDGSPDQTRLVPVGDIATNTYVTTGLITDDGTDDGVKRVVTQGERLAIVVEYASFVAGDSVLVASHYGAGAWSPHNGALIGTPYSVLFTSAWGTRSNAVQNIALQYDDGVWTPIIGAIPGLTIVQTNFNSGSTPDEVGTKFVPPVAIRAVGAWVNFNAISTTPGWSLRLYDSSNNLLASGTQAATTIQTQNQPGPAYILWDSVAEEVELEAGETYRLVLAPTIAQNITRYELAPPSVDFATAMPWGEVAVRTSRTNAASIWDDAIDGTAVPMGLLLNAIDPIKGERGGRGILRNICNFMRSFLR